jgi:hypothetical protein
MAMEAILAKRFSPFNFSSIAGYPHPVPLVDEWHDLLSRFYEGKNDIPLGMSFKTPPLFDHYGDNDEDVEVFIEEKGINIQPSNEGEIFYQEQHDQDKEPSIDIHEAISCQQLANFIKANKGEVDQQPASAFLSLVIATDIQPDVSSCKAEHGFILSTQEVLSPIL